MTKSTAEQPEAVPARATCAGEILLRWGWVESTVWTEADVDGPRTRGQRRQVVQPDRQGPLRTHTGCGVLSSRRQQTRCRSGSRDDHDVRRSPGREPQDSQRRSTDRPISAAADPQALRFVDWDELVLLKPRASPGTMSSSSQTTTTHALLAQLAEQLTLNQRVVGSSPTGGNGGSTPRRSFLGKEEK